VETFVYITDITPLKQEGRFLRLYEKMPLYRKEKIDRLKSQEDKRRSLAAGLLLEYAMHLNQIPEREIEESENGKPSIKGRSDFHFNLSHSGDKAMCIISDKEVGCDVEKIKDYNPSIARRFFSDEENLILLNEEDDLEKKQLFFRMWTLKESFIKVIGKGIALPLNEFSFIFDKKEISLKQSVTNLEYTPCESDIIEGYRCAWIIEGQLSDKGKELIEVTIDEIEGELNGV